MCLLYLFVCVVVLRPAWDVVWLGVIVPLPGPRCPALYDGPRRWQVVRCCPQRSRNKYLLGGARKVVTVPLPGARCLNYIRCHRVSMFLWLRLSISISIFVIYSSTLLRPPPRPNAAWFYFTCMVSKMLLVYSIR